VSVARVPPLGVPHRRRPLEGFAVTPFDYHYVAGSDAQTHLFSGVIVQSCLPLQPLFIRPKGLWDQILEFVDFDGIDFESAESSRKCDVRAPDKRWAYDVLQPRNMEFLLSRPSSCIQFEEEYVKVWDRKRLDPWDVEQALEVGVGILERLPECVVRQQGGKLWPQSS